MTVLLDQVYDGIVSETEYIAGRQKAEADRRTGIAFGKRGFTRASGLLSHDLRLNSETYGDMIRQGIATATDKIGQLSLASYTSQQEYQWLEHQREFGEQKQQIEFDGQKTIAESENLLQRDLASIRIEASRDASVIDLNYTKEAKEIDINGDAAAALLSAQYSVDTEMATSAIEVANELDVARLKVANEREVALIGLDAERQAQEIDITARGEAQQVSLGYEKTAQSNKIEANIQSTINEQQARIDVAVDLSYAKNKAATEVGNADIEASRYLGGVKNDGFKVVADARNETARITGETKRTAVRITHGAKSKAIADESAEKLKNIGIKQTRLLSKKRELNQAELDAMRDTNARRILEAKNLDAKKYTAIGIRNDAEYKAEVDLAIAKADANLQITLAKPALVSALNAADEQSAFELNALDVEVAGTKANKKLGVVNGEATQRLTEATRMAQLEYSNIVKINGAEDSAEATAQIGRLANVDLKAAGKKAERDIINQAQFQADKDVSNARIAADSLRFQGQNDGMDVTFAAQDYANSKRLEGNSKASTIRAVGRANLQIIDSANRAEMALMDGRSKVNLARENVEQTHTENVYIYKE